MMRRVALWGLLMTVTVSAALGLRVAQVPQTAPADPQVNSTLHVAEANINQPSVNDCGEPAEMTERLRRMGYTDQVLIATEPNDANMIIIWRRSRNSWDEPNLALTVLSATETCLIAELDEQSAPIG